MNLRLLLSFVPLLGLLPLRAQQAVHDPTFSGTVRSDIDLGGHNLLNGGFNGPSRLVQLDASGRLPAADGSLLTGLSAASLSGTVPSACLPPAIAGTLGAVRVGSGLAVDGSGIVSAVNAGTVTSVGISLPAWLSASGTPVTASGTLAVTAAGGQPANQLLATPSGSAGPVGLRALAAADVPVLNQNTTGTASNVTGVVALANGGTGQATKAAAFNALSPLSALGDLLYGGASGAGSRLAGSTSASPAVLVQTGTGAASAAPAWATTPAFNGGNLTNLNGASIQAGTVGASQLAANLLPAYAGQFKNAVIGGDFSVNPWQRGTAFGPTTSNNLYTADRWASYGGNGATQMTFSRQTGVGLAGFSAALRVQRASGNAGIAPFGIWQTIESVHVVPLQGRTVTLSFWARAGANFSAAGGILSFGVGTGTAADEGTLPGMGGTWTGSSYPISTAAVTTAWTRLSCTVTLASGVAEAAVYVFANPAGTAGANDYFDIAGVQLEEGAAPTVFERRPPAQEQQLCFRYYQVHPAIVETASIYQAWCLPVPMRANPAVTGGGSGFAVQAADPQMVVVSQTARALQTLAFSAEL